MKIIEKKTNLNINKNFLTIDTTGLSYDKNYIFSIGLIDFEKNIIKYYVIEDLKEEYNILKNFLNDYANKTFISFNGNNFEENFFRKRAYFYNLDFNIKLISISKILKDYKYIFNLDSYSKKSIEKFFNMKIDRVDGFKIIKIIENYLKDNSNDNLLDNTIINLNSLTILWNNLNRYLEERLSFFINKNKFKISKIRKEKNTIIIEGCSSFSKKYVNFNSFYNLYINKNFKLEINTEDANYDELNKCYYIKKAPNVKNKSAVKSPDEILILYYLDFLYENILEIVKYIFYINLQ